MMTPCHHKKRHSATQQKKANDSHQLQGASELVVPSSVRVLCGARILQTTNVCGALIVLTHRALSVQEELFALARLGGKGRCGRRRGRSRRCVTHGESGHFFAEPSPVVGDARVDAWVAR